MRNDPGAIVLIVYYILLKSNKAAAYFRAEFIFREYKRMLKVNEDHDVISCINERYKKHTRGRLPITLSSEARIDSCLKLHHNAKDILWFEISNDGYRFKSKYLSRLDEALSVCV